MKDWEKTLIGPQATLREALKVIDATGAGMSLVVDESRRLLGTLSDGDVRRALIQGASLESPTSAVLNPNPKCAPSGQSQAAMLVTLRSLGLHQLPVVSQDRTVVGLATTDDYLSIPLRTHWVVIMAGGRGERLRELTRTTPKPMLKVGSRPILETIVTHYADQGFRNFYLAVNYKAEQIEAHFGDGASRGVNITYLREKEPLGTGGALSLLTPRPAEPIVVTNGDVLSKEDYGFVLDAHIESGADATVLVRDYEMQVPFGVIVQDDNGMTSIREKPTQHFNINAGVYVLSPKAIELVPENEFFDMPSLLERMLTRGMRVRCHRAEAYWMDIGRVPDFENANSEFGAVFGC
jgi:dTDP-glucose pyrophosphorylase